MPDDLPDIIEIEAGQSRIVQLPGHGVGGYLWSAQMISGTAKVETLPIGAPAGPAIGGGATVSFRITVVGAGDSHIRFTLARPWEHDVSASTKDLTVRGTD